MLCALLSPATQAPVAGWACVQVAWAGNFLLGPWFVGRLMAERPLGAVGAGWALLKVRHEGLRLSETFQPLPCLAPALRQRL